REVWIESGVKTFQKVQNGDQHAGDVNPIFVSEIGQEEEEVRPNGAQAGKVLVLLEQVTNLPDVEARPPRIDAFAAAHLVAPASQTETGVAHGTHVNKRTRHVDPPDRIDFGMADRNRNPQARVRQAPTLPLARLLTAHNRVSHLSTSI